MQNYFWPKQQTFKWCACDVTEKMTVKFAFYSIQNYAAALSCVNVAVLRLLNVIHLAAEIFERCENKVYCKKCFNVFCACRVSSTHRS